MSRADYYRHQAQLLFTWALATSDPDYAARLEGLAKIFLVAADVPEDPAFCDLSPYLDEFNTHQMRKENGAALVRPQQQQQQPPPKKDED